MTTHTEVQSKNLIHRENDEINLVDLLITLVHRKRIMMVALSISLLIAIGYLWVTKPFPAYEGTSVVQVGTVLNAKDSAILLQELKIEYPFANVIEKSGVNFITIKMKSSSREEIKPQLKKTTNRLLEKYSVMYNALLATKQAKLQKKKDFLNKKREFVKSQMAELEHLIKVMKITKSVQASLVLEKIKLMGNLEKIKDSIYTLNASNSIETKSMSGKLFRDITVKEAPVKSKIAKVILLSIVSGLMLGVISVFITELIITIRQQMAVTEK